jgi:RNA 3'-phosphate cyclase
MLTIDGSRGEGGGQILRSSLALSLLTGRAFRIVRIRAGRPRPGLQPQHLQSVLAAAAVGGARVEGAAPGSREVEFEPGPAAAGEYRFDVGTAGSVSLVLQTVFVPLALAGAESRLTLIGGTHVPWSPTFEYLREAWLPAMRAIGFDADVELELAGFYPKGGGRVTARIRPAARPAPLRLTERGPLRRIRGMSRVANLPESVAERQRGGAVERLGERGIAASVEVSVEPMPSRFKGTSILLTAEFEGARLTATAIGRLGRPAEEVGREAADALADQIASDGGAVDRHMADQILLPLAFAGGESEFRTCEATAHLRTNAHVLDAFLGDVVRIEGNLIGVRGRARA